VSAPDHSHDALEQRVADLESQVERLIGIAEGLTDAQANLLELTRQLSSRLSTTEMMWRPIGG
jgi:uncharacterized protein involved in exopolysaccharide biosynthesis